MGIQHKYFMGIHGGHSRLHSLHKIPINTLGLLRCTFVSINTLGLSYGNHRDTHKNTKGILRNTHIYIVVIGKGHREKHGCASD